MLIGTREQERDQGRAGERSLRHPELPPPRPRGRRPARSLALARNDLAAARAVSRALLEPGAKDDCGRRRGDEPLPILLYMLDRLDARRSPDPGERWPEEHDSGLAPEVDEQAEQGRVHASADYHGRFGR